MRDLNPVNANGLPDFEFDRRRQFVDENLEDRNDLEDDTSVRGKKLEILRKSMKWQAQFWTIGTCLAFAFMIIVKIQDKTKIDLSCAVDSFKPIKKASGCHCIHFFKGWIEFYCTLSLGPAI